MEKRDRKQYKNIETFQEQAVFKNPHLKHVFTSSEMAFPKPLTISQISFSSKSLIEEKVLMSGDTAGMIHPLCGNGMSMAILSAQLLSQAILKHRQDREQLELAYSKAWNKSFRKRLLVGHFFNSFLSRNGLFEWTIRGLGVAPQLLPVLIRQTHGKPSAMTL